MEDCRSLQGVKGFGGSALGFKDLGFKALVIKGYVYIYTRVCVCV